MMEQPPDFTGLVFRVTGQDRADLPPESFAGDDPSAASLFFGLTQNF